MVENTSFLVYYVLVKFPKNTILNGYKVSAYYCKSIEFIIMRIMGKIIHLMLQLSA